MKGKLIYFVKSTKFCFLIIAGGLILLYALATNPKQIFKEFFLDETTGPA